MTRTQKTVLGLAIGVLVCLLLITGILIGAATVGWKSAVRAGNEAAALQSLKTIGAAQNEYYSAHGRRFGTFEELANERLIDARFSAEAPLIDGYVYQLAINQTAANAQPIFAVTADPQDSSTGRNHFYRDSSSDDVRFNPEQKAGPKDTVWKKEP